MEERKPRKLLVASIGVATLVYAACSAGQRYNETSGNLMPPADTGATEEDVGFDVKFDVGADTGSDTSAQDSSSKDSNDDG